ncbi:unnamed protein product [Rhizophagus irregularis]|uniref:Uncharacterized protein n=1 Tax=Rhizophagus irregularis TaxID=588596 RepID=A0A2I1HQH2_9GLOM|nr:hypothetical protein RhiirA4_485726 [Rhizophagus irregularis]CAB4431875.1 unnamed protein product [Rhizophagus irregularis]
MRLDKGLHEDDSDDDENDPELMLILVDCAFTHNNDLPYVRKYLLFHRARFEPFINTPFWFKTLSLPARNFISEVYTENVDIQFTPCERSTSDYPVTPISPSLDSPIDDLFERSFPDDLSSRVVDHFSSLENAGISTLTSIRKQWYEKDFDDEFLSEDDKNMDEFMGQMYAACGLPPISSCSSRSLSPVPVSYDNTSLIFLSDSDDDLMDSDDDSSFLPFDEETYTYHVTEWLELFFRSVCFSFIPIYMRSPSSGLDLTEISSRPLPSFPVLPLSPSFLDLRVANGRRMFWKLFQPSPGLLEFLFVPPLLTADFKFYDKIFSFQPSIYDQITRFACLFEIFAGILLFVRRILGFLHYFFLCIFKFFSQQSLIAKMRYSFLADVLLSYLHLDLSQFGVLLPVGITGVVEQSSSDLMFWS